MAKPTANLCYGPKRARLTMNTVKIGMDRILMDSGINPRKAAVESAGFDDDGNLVLGVSND